MNVPGILDTQGLQPPIVTEPVLIQEQTAAGQVPQVGQMSSQMRSPDLDLNTWGRQGDEGRQMPASRAESISTKPPIELSPFLHPPVSFYLQPDTLSEHVPYAKDQECCIQLKQPLPFSKAYPFIVLTSQQLALPVFFSIPKVHL